MITSNESAPATSSAQQPASNGGFGAQIRSVLLSNLAAAVGALWSVFLFVGGLIFLVYFASIGFMPAVDLQTSIALLVVSALTGGFLLIALGFYLLAPGWWWVQVTRHQEPLKSPGWFILPMLGVILSIFLTQSWWCLIPIFIVGVIASLLLILCGGKLLDKLGPKQRWETAGVFCLGFFPIVVFLVPFLLLLVVGLIRENPELSKYAILPALFASTLILTGNTILVANRSSSILQFLILAAATIFYLFTQLNTWHFIPKRMMSIYKFGNLQNASLVLNEIGCAIVQHHGLKVTPYTPDPKTDTTPNPKTCSLPSSLSENPLA